jgi:peptidyl-prolyl cis-trans isomerase C
VPETVKADDVEAKTEKAAPVEAKPAPVEAKPVPVEAKPEPVEAKPVPVEQPPEVPVVGDRPVEPSDVVGEIDGYAITRKELETRLMRETRSERDSDRVAAAFVDAETLLLKMLGEKAMIIEGRKGGLLEQSSTLKEFYEEQMVQLLFSMEMSNRVKVTESEIDEKLKSNPKLDRARAKSMLQASKSRDAAEQYFDELSEKLYVKKLRYNFPKVAQAHQRLLHRPQSERKVFWIRHSQMENELTEQEKNTPLVTFDGGQVTLMDWFERLNMIPPLKRPKDLGTVQGVERLLDGAIEMPVFAAEARSRGLDKDENFLKQIAPREERIIFGEVRRKVFAGISNPTEEEIREYFNSNKEKFRTADTLKTDQIWCEDLEAARKVKSELDGGKDFELVKQEYSLKKGEKPSNVKASREGVFFRILWAAEPNDIVGPIKGFYKEEFRWRVVRILEKKPGRMQGYDKVARKVKSRIRRERREAKLAEYRKELLAKYPYTIHREKIKDLDLLDMP